MEVASCELIYSVSSAWFMESLGQNTLHRKHEVFALHAACLSSMMFQLLMSWEPSKSTFFAQFSKHGCGVLYAVYIIQLETISLQTLPVCVIPLAFMVKNTAPFLQLWGIFSACSWIHRQSTSFPAPEEWCSRAPCGSFGPVFIGTLSISRRECLDVCVRLQVLSMSQLLRPGPYVHMLGQGMCGNWGTQRGIW